ncbi:hypothetical protein [Flavobacterium selenitireducens]|uniref:hypothetical protein n=1 Tax=Flavobacterium selenitireducens TaxID=2722704 RepID=UPI00168B732B|nr:hypothetical protein [Flavobacterium selenitireducens]MBD3581581.1 hypothetical protein [Flavobacterium selenitireducens]
MKDSVKAAFKKYDILIVFVCLLGTYLTFPGYFALHIWSLPPEGEAWTSLDPSWQVAMNYTDIKHLVWGKDIAFTYGPLHYLATRNQWGLSKWPLFLYDVFTAINYFAIFYISIKKFRNVGLGILAIVLIILLHPFWIASAKVFVLTAFLVFWIRLSLDQPKPIYYAFQIVLTSLLFFVKFNTGLITVILFLAGITYNLLTKDKKWRFIIYGILPLLAIALLLKPLNVHFVGYLKSGLDVVSGYNGVMYFDSAFSGAIGHVIAWIILLIGLLAYSYKETYRTQWLKLGTVSFLFFGTAYILYKQGFTRADSGHVVEFFFFLPMFVLAIPEFYQSRNKWAVGIFFLSFIIPFHYLFIKEDYEIDTLKFSKAEYWEKFPVYDYDSAVLMYQNHIPMPEPILEKIGNSTVDVYPWNIQGLLENKLNYHARPVLQSYVAYTKYLEDLNFEHYNNADTAPEFVVYQLATIDERYAMFDESKTTLALLKNYTPVDTYQDGTGTKLLLRKAANFKPLKLEKVGEYAMMLGDGLVPKADILYEIEVYDNLLGKFVSLVRHSSPLQLNIHTVDGQRKSFRTSNGLLQSGIFGNYFIQSTEDYGKLYSNPAVLPEISYYSVTPKYSSHYGDKLRITEYKIIH